MKKIEIKFLDSSIKNFSIPKYQTSGSSGLDLHACIKNSCSIYPKETKLISTGFAIFIKDNTISAMIIPRSGLGHNHGIILGNSVGLVDSDYQGPILVSLWNRGKKTFFVHPGDRIAQMIFIKTEKIEFKLVESFSSISERGENGFGHSGI